METEQKEGAEAPAAAGKNELHALVLQDVQNRTEWAERQAVWYQMRHNGLRRRNKPYPGAADLHYPLVDGMIDKWKPFYFQQLYATETLSTFVSKDREHQAYTSELSYHFDYKLKQRSNLEKAILVTIDQMLMSGAAVLKTYWDTERKRVCFDSIKATHLIVPWYTKELQEADRLVHVMEISPDQYRRNSNYKQDAEFIKRITGRGGAQPDGASTTEQEMKLIREGITVASSDSQILIWECYSREKLTGPRQALQEGIDKAPAPKFGWVVRTWSPLAPDDAIRAPFQMIYEHGEAPFVRFESEVTDSGHYSPRGLPEVAGAFETSLCKLWNGKFDYMDFCNRPIFTTDREIVNAGNIRMAPGQILGFGLKKVEMGAPPVSFDQEMVNTRMVAEHRVGMPDFGIGQQINTSDRRTKYELQQIGSQAGQIVDLRARLFRGALGQLYRQAWGLLRQFDRDTAYLQDDQLKQLDSQALADAYEVMPNGSSDSWNREAKLQKAIARKQLLGTSPYVNQAELDKSILELDDPKLVARMWMDPKIKAASEYEAEAVLIPTLMLGMPLQPKAGEDRVARIKCLVDFVEQRGNAGAPVDPLAVQTIRTRINAQLAALQQEQPQLAAQVQQELAAKMGQEPEAAAA